MTKEEARLKLNEAQNDLSYEVVLKMHESSIKT